MKLPSGHLTESIKDAPASALRSQVWPALREISKVPAWVPAMTVASFALSV